MLTYRGFTLVELLVVIALIAILAVMGFAAYRGLIARGNDSKRQSDIIAISKALEANKTAVGYQPLANNQFGSSTVPTDPISSNRQYCISSSATGTNGNPPNSLQLFNAGTTCYGTGATGVGANDQGWALIAPGVPAGGNITVWMICTLLDNPVNGSTVMCLKSSQ